MDEKLKMKQMILREQVEDRQKVSKQLWRVYYKEMMRLIENPSSQPDTSELDKFIRDNVHVTFDRELASLFKDALEFGFGHAGFVSENLFME